MKAGTKLPTDSDSVITELGKLKFRLLSEGMRIHESAVTALENAKNPIRTRSGVSGGLDIKLGNDVYVNVPVREVFAKSSHISLHHIETSFVLMEDGAVISEINVLPLPDYYQMQTPDGEQMKRIGQMCSGDRFCYGMTGPGCHFWSEVNRCRYCSIGNNFDADAVRKQEKHLVEVLGHAISDGSHPAKHVLIGGGTPPGEDMGAVLAAKLCKAIKQHYNISIYVMIAAPLKNDYIDMLYDAGADELGMNVEFWSDEAWHMYIPGKEKEIGKKRYIEALEYAFSKFGPINTRSILIAGLEDFSHTVEGAIQLASRGVMPIISPFRPLTGTMLENDSGFDADTYTRMFSELSEKLSSEYDMPLGPTCVCCQNNTLALPIGKYYRYY
ncbi:MAG: radical SAM protein [Chloroflexi bacterium]|nr:radical SAM protein [Chloroflexota bacterium]